MPYLGKTPSQATRQRYYKTASGGETSISGTMTTGGTLTFNDGEFVDVSVNGVALVAGTDYNTTTANTIGGLSALSANDQVEIVVYDTFSVFGGNVDGDFTINNGTLTATTISASGNVDFNGDLDVDGTTNLDVVDIDGAVDMASTLQVDGAITSSAGATITTADNTTQLTLKSTDDDASEGPRLDLRRDSASPADNDVIGTVRFLADDDSGSSLVYAEIQTHARDVSAGATDSEMQFLIRRGGTTREAIQLNENSVIFNDAGDDVDFRIESDGNASMFFLDGGNNTVGIGTNAATNPLTVRGDGGTGATAALRIRDEGNQGATLGIQNDGDCVLVVETKDFNINTTGGNVRVEDGNLVIGTSGKGIDFSATANSAGSMGSELLDDYEEGSWTPTLSTNSGNAASFNSSTGRYTKIGRMVMIQCSMSNINTSGTTGGSQVRITGLPFTCEEMTGHGAAVFDQITLQGGRTQLTAAVTTAEHVALTQSGGGAIGDTPTDHNDINSGGSDIIFSAVYISSQ